MFGWGRPTTSQRAQATRTSERYPSEVCVTLPDGQLMYVRNASLAAAKDLLAAQHAAERRIAAQREARLLREATEVVTQKQASPSAK
jgi:hypothetical protein